ncbi:endoribonuclease Dicer homolog 2-like isoform X2 [Trifolium pratense]|nr:endoribonuclease Dicer homolog 2-like isoform X2 [Trifolium pratense]XP_045805971.1 endoribonuclease Dicer homolog 2-like isoform X2 [Trifolium pratense]XP_045805972.1 endoribonuclease Dicer homolog 2-like isoform X2 [Trifolium pratense]XP_045805973.1 endoribonuclease Dicer homolog 2-like isoform X2 [Trifolium pratense]XP_045805974.1 endoribonuclease Dicer homolog 2-like isoform X2 [Trifolium pratense]
MEEALMEMDGYGEQQIMPDALPFARSYQLEALDKAIRQNTIVYLETGSGKTLIAIMLLRSYAYHLRKPSPNIAVFLVPKVVLVSQQAKALKNHTDLKVGMYWGDMGVDYWDGAMWKAEMEKHEVLVMTPAILLSCLRHSFIKLKMIKVLIMDECHHTSGKHPYACIMTEFYHHQLRSGITELPRIFGMTASPIKSKAANSESTLSKNIRELMTLMHSKVYTCISDAVLSQFIPTSTPKFRYYKDNIISYALFEELAQKLLALKQKHELYVTSSDFTKSAIESAHKKIARIFTSSIFCLDELGVWLALKAAESLSSIEIENFLWGNSGDQIVKKFSSATMLTLQSYVPSDPQWTIGYNMDSDVKMGLLTSRVSCLIDCLLEYQGFTEMRCIVFVERVITAIVLEVLLNTLLPKYNSWRAKYIAGNSSRLQHQSRKTQNEIVEEFRMGLVNIIVATSILEEGLDVQSCNLVIRFDPCPTVCSFVQSRGRARMQNSDYILMVNSGDFDTRSRLEKYLGGSQMMRKESLRQSSLPCESLEIDQFQEQAYRVASTEAVVNLSSSITLIYLYCSRLPSDGYFKPTPRWDKEKGILYLPKSCPLQAIHVQGETKFLKNIACLEACKQLHKIGALTDYLVPSIVIEEAEVEEFGNEPYDEEQPSYVPFELVNRVSNNSNTIYHCYLIELKQNFSYDITVKDIFLATRVMLEPEIGCMQFDMCFDKGSLSVKLNYKGSITLSPDQVLLCKRFQATVLGILTNNKMDKESVLDKCCSEDDYDIDYLLLPSIVREQTTVVDWLTINSVHPSEIGCLHHVANIWTEKGLVCGCILQNALIFTPHNGRTYITTNIMELDGNSPLEVGNGEVTTYKKYFGQKHGIQLRYEHQRLLKARHVFSVKNYCHGSRQTKDRDASKTYVELPPELCSIIMSPISVDTLYSFSYIPSIMHRLESLLGAFNFKKMHLDHCPQNRIETFKVLEAITTKSCNETFHYESLETLGDSFLKYAVSQQLFNTYQNHHEGLLSVKREKIICNAALCKLGCGFKLPGFIRNEPFDPKTWIIPGAKSRSFKLEEIVCNGREIYTRPNRKLRRKVVADVVEALIGAFLSAGGEVAALLFMDWIGIKVNFNITPYERQFNACPENIVNVGFLESLLKYTFRDHSLLVEALTHGSYMLPEVPRCYQRLEYLGDSVLDYLITMHLYKEYPGMSPGQLTDMRSASVNNDCYAWSAIKVQLHKHVLHTSQELHKHIVATLDKYDELSSPSTFGWESEASFPKVLGDVIESLAGAILVDSGYNKEVVWQSIRPLLEPLVTPDTLTIHPVRELTELCQKMNYTMKKPLFQNDDGVTSCKVEVIADGIIHQYEHKGFTDRKTAKRLACKGVLNSLQLKETQDK